MKILNHQLPLLIWLLFNSLSCSGALTSQLSCWLCYTRALEIVSTSTVICCYNLRKVTASISFFIFPWARVRQYSSSAHCSQDGSLQFSTFSTFICQILRTLQHLTMYCGYNWVFNLTFVRIYISNHMNSFFGRFKIVK